MPSPLGHALAGMAAGWAVARPATVPGRPWHAGSELRWTGLAFGILGVLPDIDLLFPTHRGATHSLAAALIVGLAAAALTKRARLGAASGAAYGTHALLDWLGSDTSPPLGIMAWWPFSREYYHSAIDLFDAISRRYWLPGFWEHNFLAIAREVAILLPLLLLVAYSLRRRRRFDF